MSLEDKLIEKGVERFTNTLKEKSASITGLLDRYNLDDIKLKFNKTNGKWEVSFEGNEKLENTIKELVIAEVVNRLNDPVPYNYSRISREEVGNLLNNFIVRF